MVTLKIIIFLMYDTFVGKLHLISFLRNFILIILRAKVKGLCKFMYSHFFHSDKNKRRTKTVKKTLEPKWNQTFIYP